MRDHTKPQSVATPSNKSGLECLQGFNANQSKVVHLVKSLIDKGLENKHILIKLRE